MAIASCIDLTTLDSLARTCRAARAGLLPYRSALMRGTLRCANEDAPVDADEALRYRARAGNWYYMEDAGRSASYSGKSGQCARDMVSECRQCAAVVCRVRFPIQGRFLCCATHPPNQEIWTGAQ